MAIKIAGTEVVSNARELKNIATVDSTTVSTLNTALNVDPTKGTLTKTFTQNETAEITLSSNVTVGPVVSATKEVPQTGISTKGNWDVNSTASNYDFHSTAANVTLTPSSVANANISDATYANKSYQTGAGSNRGIIFNDDGTKMYVLDDYTYYLNYHTLTTAYDITTASYVSYVNLTVATGAVAMAWNNDGTRLFVLSNINDGVYEHSLSTAYDISTLSYITGSNFSVANGDNDPRGLFFKPDGTKFYTVGLQNNTVHEWHLSTAFDLSTGNQSTYQASFSVNSQSTSPRSVVFNSSGTKMYIGDGGNNTIHQYSLSTAWDVSSASYDSVSLNVSQATGTVQGFILANGNLYVSADGSGSYIYQYANSSTALVLGSGSFASSDVGKRIVGNGGDVVLTSTGGAFSTTGGSAFTDSSTIAAGSWSMFGLKSAGDASGITMSGISTLSPIDLANGSYDNKSVSTSSQAGSNDGVFFKPDGTRMYVIASGGGTNKVWQYDLSTAWDVSTGSYNGVSKDFSSYTSNSGGLFFKPDGTKMYIADRQNNQIDEWTLSTAWDLSSAGYTTNANIVTHTSDIHGLFWKPDGTKFYTADQGNYRIVQYNVNSGYTWNINNWSHHGTGYIGGQEAQMHDVEFTSDGTKMFIVGRGSDKIYQYSLSTAWDVTTISYDNVFLDVSSEGTQPNGLHLKADDQTKFYVVNSGSQGVFQYSTGASEVFTQPTAQYHVGVTNTSGRIDSSAFIDINSMTAAQVAGSGTVNYAVSTDGRTTWSVAKGTDGVRPIVRNNSGTWQYNNNGGTTSVNANISSATYSNKSFSPANQTGSVLSVSFISDGTKMYVAGGSNAYQYNLSTAWDVSTATYSNNSLYFGNVDNTTEAFFIKPDGTKAWFVGRSFDHVRQIDLSTAGDLSTASVTTGLNKVQFNVGNQEASPTGLTFKSDGTKMYIIGTTGDDVNEYSLSTAWDVSTASYTQNFSVASQDTAPNGVSFNISGTKMYVSGEQNNRVYQYNLSTAWDVSSASYSNYSLNASSQDGSVQGVFIGNSDGTIYVVGDTNNKIFQYTNSSNAYATTATWANGTVNDELYTLQEALGAQAFNRMDKTQLDAVADANHFATGSSLDLMIALRMDAAASTLPTSDGVTLNYDSASLNEGAVLGTDYDFFHPAANKVQIKSLAAQNLKVRVV